VHYYTRALALNPNNPTVLANLGDLYVHLGEPAKGMDYLKEAKVVDPFFAPKWYWLLVGRAYFVTHQYDEAIVAFARFPSTRVWGPAYLAACYALTGNIDRSNHHAAEVLRLMPEFSISRYVPGAVQAFKRPQTSDRRASQGWAAGITVASFAFAHGFVGFCEGFRMPAPMMVGPRARGRRPQTSKGGNRGKGYVGGAACAMGI
jgi:tetratricopeptide (TPR) repeat protein